MRRAYALQSPLHREILFCLWQLFFKLFSVLKHIIFYELSDLWGGATSISDGIF